MVTRRLLCVEGDKAEMDEFKKMLPTDKFNVPDKEPITYKPSSVPGATANSSRHFQSSKLSKTSSSTTPGLTMHHFMDAAPKEHRSTHNGTSSPRHGLAAPSSSSTSSSFSKVDDALNILGPRTLPPSLAPKPSYQPPITSYTSYTSTSSTSSSLTTARPSSLRSTLPDTFGFRNNGNSCYINSALQAILSLTPFISDLGSAVLGERVEDIGLESLYRALLSVIDRTWQEKRKKVMDPSRVKFAFARVHDDFRNSFQQDVHEFFGQVLQQLEFEFMPFLNEARRLQLQQFKKSKRNQKKRRRVERSRAIEEDASTDSEESEADSAEEDVPYSDRATLLCPVKRNFTGVVQSIYTCLACKDVSLSPEVLHFLQLDVFSTTEEMVEHHISKLKGDSNQPIADEQALRDALELKYTCPPSIESLLSLYFCPETVERKCEKCTHKVSRLRRAFVQIPRVLVIQLKRFRYDYKTQTSDKLDYPIEASETFDLSKWCSKTSVSGPLSFESNLEETLEASSRRFRKLEDEEEELKQTLQERREIAAAKKLAARPASSAASSARPNNPAKSALQNSSVRSSINTSSTSVSLGSAKTDPAPWEKRASGLHDERSSEFSSRLNEALNFDDADEVDDILKEVLPDAKRAKVKEIEIVESDNLSILSGPPATEEDDEELEIEIPLSSVPKSKPLAVEDDEVFESDISAYNADDLPDAFDSDLDHKRYKSGLKGGDPPKARFYEEEENDAVEMNCEGMSDLETRMWTQARVALLNRQFKEEKFDDIIQSPLPILELPISNGSSSRASPPAAPTANASAVLPSTKPRLAETIDLEDDDPIVAKAMRESAREQKAYEENEAALKRLMEEEEEKPKPRQKPYDLEGAFEGIGNVQSILHAHNDYENDQVAPYIKYAKDSTPGSVTTDPPRPPLSYGYGIQAVIHHVGATANSGHYVADVRSSTATTSFIKPPAKDTDSIPPKLKPWLHFDDTSVSESSSDGVLKPGTTPYLLFYVHSKVSCK